MQNTPEISIAVPFYNEEEAIDSFFEAIVPILQSTGCSFEIVGVNDGSTDNTWELLCKYTEKYPFFRALDLSRNFGKEAALTAALDYCRGLAVIPIDADLQDPPELIPKMIEKWKEGYEVVVARRCSRSSDSMLKRFSAGRFYQIFNLLSEHPITPDAGDFRLMDYRVVVALKQLRESNRFMKGLFSWVGYRTAVLEFDRQPRSAGNTKWSPIKLIGLAWDGIAAFSYFPLRIWTYLGLTISLLSFIYASFLIIRTVVGGIDVPGYSSIMVVMLFLGGIQLIGLGVLGEYLGKVYKEVKQRPIYLVRETK
jgi:polyisoprenyl-phosphate glycosyltransferase